MPVGTILPYVGDLADIPKGWYLCNGSNDTPDLTGRFLQGWGWDDYSNHNILEYLNPGLPNIEGSINLTKVDYWGRCNGAFYTINMSYVGNSGYTDGDYRTNNNIGFNASICSSIYGNSNTVQPRACIVYYIMRIK